MIVGNTAERPFLPIEAPLEPGSQPGSRIVDLTSGLLQVRLAESALDIDAAQALRYRIFYEQMGARALPEMARQRRDFDDYDALCDHLLVLDRALGDGPEAIVGTYRLIRRPAAARQGAFYSAAEFDISALLRHPGEILELGRSCVDPAYRGRGAMQLLWAGVAAYVFHYDIVLMFGCASLPGTDPDAAAEPLSYLFHHRLAPAPLRPQALPERYVEMARLARSAFDPARTAAQLPPLIKGYLRLGGFVGDGAVIDHQFNTIDVCVVVKTDLVTQKYTRHYERRSRDTWGL
ncbi:MAG TPA: GNAT family N-acyltransferase [Stellaceae bacterium]|nr:GNAT family N-acyltransferase [Stellaceae bacterium]